MFAHRGNRETRATRSCNYYLDLDLYLDLDSDSNLDYDSDSYSNFFGSYYF